ncbi:MAG TPA: peptidoglycan DD-metalloendopeptidase family protein, partial [Chloroflexaceae bacterium]|nr:peptidoglycan DD-metalloendopeptidase family protein [Chloroflexaceae bacterium]
MPHTTLVARPVARLALPLVVLLLVTLTAQLILPVARASEEAPLEPQNVASLQLKLPFPAGEEWRVTNGWDAHDGYADSNGDGQLGDWNRKAIDFVPASGSCLGKPVLAAAPGKVVNTDTGAGRRFARHEVEIDHGTFNGVNYRTLYVHLDTVRVSDGQQVGYGTQIGTCGGYPNFAPHLHFQLYAGPTWDRYDGIIPVPIDGITSADALRSNRGGLRSTNSAIPPIDMHIDAPANGATVSGTVNIQGWAIHRGGSGTGVSQVHIYFGGPAGSGAPGVAATYGADRPDVAAAYGDQRYRYSGFWYSWDTRGVAAGAHTLYIYIQSTQTGWSEYTRTVTVRHNSAPRQPTLVAPANGSTLSDRALTLTWQDQGDPDNFPRSYRDYEIVLRKLDGSWSQRRPWATESSWALTVPSDGTYAWRVQAGDGELASGWTAERTFTVITPPAVATQLAVSGDLGRGLTVTWRDGADNEAGFYVYKWICDAAGCDWQRYATLGADSTSFTDRAISCSVTYFYDVSAFNAAGESPRAGWVAQATPSCGPERPSGLRVTAALTTAVTLAWDATAGAEGFYVYKWICDDGSCDWRHYATLGANATSYTDQAVACGVTFFYDVSAFSAAGESFRAGWVEVRPGECPAEPPPAEPPPA